MLAGGLYERTSGAAGQPLGDYRRRAPERTVLHELVALHAQTLLAELRERRAASLRRARARCVSTVWRPGARPIVVPPDRMAHCQLCINSGRVPPVELPSGDAKVLGELKQRIEQTRLATAIAANTAMTRLYWHVGRFVVVELKAVKFDLGMVGQLHMYLSSVDDMLEQLDDQPTIGLLLCRGKNELVVEYALRDQRRPMGVADWETQLVEKLPDALKGSLPSIDEIEAALAPPRLRTTKRKK